MTIVIRFFTLKSSVFHCHYLYERVFYDKLTLA